LGKIFSVASAAFQTAKKAIGQRKGSLGLKPMLILFDLRGAKAPFFHIRADARDLTSAPV